MASRQWSLVLPPDLRQELVQHALAENPDEACGILAGRIQGERMVVERVMRVQNTADSVAPDQGVFRDRESGQPAAGRKAVHYYMDPKDQLRVYNEIDDLGLDVVGYYHSHTHTEARPSPTDIRLATDLSGIYVLVGLEDPEHPSVRAWSISKSDPTAEVGEAIELAVSNQ